MYNKILLLIPFALLILVSSCKDDDDSDGNTDQRKEEVLSSYADYVIDSYKKSKQDAVALQSAIQTFTNSPSDATLTAAKNAWLTARESYGPTEAFRFAEGPIDVIGTVEGPEGLLNSWPLDENYIDYVQGDPNAGIINDVTQFPTITKSLLEDINGHGGEENVSVGYHAIEFLLWGQDLTAPSANLAGQRSYEDYTTLANADRRKEYLNITADLLIDHLQILIDEWENNYKTTFLNQDEDVALSNVMTGIATLSKAELAGERMYVAYDNQSQEDEHSCFSDNTHRDIRLNFYGIKDIYFGDYSTQSTTSIADLIRSANPSLATEIEDAFATTESAVEATGNPFDIAITDASERPKVIDAVNELRNLGDKIAEGGSALGITVRTE